MKLTSLPRRCWPALVALGVTLCILVAPLGVHAEGPAIGKPAPGVGGNADPAQVAREQARLDREAVEKAEHVAHVAREEARERGDLGRAAFEKKYRPGPVKAENRPEFEGALAGYRQAIALDPNGEIGSYCRQRLAGAYLYVGNLDEAGRILADALAHARRPEEQISALQGLALHELQSRHRPAEALPWARAMQTTAETFTDESMRAKWRVAAAETVAACEAKMGVGKGK